MLKPWVVRRLFALTLALLLVACATPPAFDYSAYRKARPRSILVLPPVNNTPDVLATPGVLAQMTLPLAESGYYVFPVAVVNETFRQNGLDNAAEIRALAPARLQQIFGADAALYVTVKRYGAVYAVFVSNVVVDVEAELVDLRSGQTLWKGRASAAADEGDGGGNQPLAAVLLRALVQQVVNNLSDASFRVAGVASQRLLLAGREGAPLYGPYHPLYAKDALAGSPPAAP